ncbi:hypothetical protein [Pelolinea submarina]|uniref:Uncharacterized protein n=1 Tax=Pelolinea submarina TaxID=913107 RepID=A0A347ZNI5_9CHLR|nr:hypothetical protein [Pelolinea submarina]REG08469.1 hypothetical protein DFR64_1836 [Pelolinea submarina]BBB46866.1 hypothetical protein Pelsub_P0093 [Pelolinea submarina]
MASVQIKNSFAGKGDSEVYEAALQAIPNAGLSVWKKRDLARLVMGTGDVDGNEVRCNIAVSMVDGSVTVSVEGEDLDEATAQKTADSLMSELGKLLA